MPSSVPRALVSGALLVASLVAAQSVSHADPGWMGSCRNGASISVTAPEVYKTKGELAKNPQKCSWKVYHVCTEWYSGAVSGDSSSAFKSGSKTLTCATRFATASGRRLDPYSVS